MEHKINFRSVLFVIFIHLSVLNCTHLSRTYFKDVFTNSADDMPKISWLFSDSVDNSIRVKRASINSQPENSLLQSMSNTCQKNLNQLCGNIVGSNDELMLLECIQNFKVYVLIVYKLIK